MNKLQSSSSKKVTFGLNKNMTAGESNKSVCLQSLSCSQGRGKLCTLVHTCTFHLFRPTWFWSLLAQYLWIVYKPSSGSCPEEMVKLRTLGPTARLAWFQGVALLTWRWSLMSRKQCSRLTNSPSWAACSAGHLLGKHAHCGRHCSLLFARQRCRYADELRLYNSKFLFYLGCLWFINGSE